MAEASKGPRSQKLYQVAYLGKTHVGEHCSTVVLPWIIEELRLGVTKDYLTKTYWFNSGLECVSVVEEDGKELLRCYHKDVVFSASSPDDSSFAVVMKGSDGGPAFCHGFMTSIPTLTGKLLQNLRMHKSLSGSALSQQTLSSAHLSASSPITKASSTQEGLNKMADLSCQDIGGGRDENVISFLGVDQSAQIWVREFDGIHYAGSLRVRSPNMASVNLDKLLDRLKKLQLSTKATPSMLPPNGVRSGSVEETDSPGLGAKRKLFQNGGLGSTAGEISAENDRSLINLLDSSESLLQDQSSLKQNHRLPSTAHRGGTPPPDSTLVSNGGARSPASVAMLNGSSKSSSPSPPPCGKKNGDVNGVSSAPAGNLGSEGTGLVTDDEVAEHSLTESESSLPKVAVERSTNNECTNGNGTGTVVEVEVNGVRDADHSDVLPKSYVHHKGVLYRSVRMSVDTVRVRARRRVSDCTVLEKKMTAVACCVQGKVNQDHFCFVSKESTSQSGATYYCHIFRGDNRDLAYRVLDAFRASFLQALTSTRPGVLCPACPLLQLFLLCKELENQSLTTTQQQTKVNEALTNLSDKDYSSLMAEYKDKNLESEHDQLVSLVALYRKHLEDQQEDHSHSSNDQDDESSSQGKKLLAKGKLKSVSRLEKAKQSVASSLESIRSKVQRRSSSKGPENPPLLKHCSVQSPEVPLLRDTSTGNGGSSQETQEDRQRSSSMPESSRNVISKDILRSGSVKEQRHRLPPLSIIKSIGQTTTGSGEGTEDPEDPTAGDRAPPLQAFARSLSSSTHSSTLRTGSGSFSEPSSPLQATPPELRHRRQLSLVSPASAARALGRGGRTAHASLSEVVTPSKQRSWRQAAYNSATPHFHPSSSITNTPSIQDLLAASELTRLQKLGLRDSPRSRARKRWQALVEQQIILNSMNKTNQKLIEGAQVAEKKRIRLCYDDPTIQVLKCVLQWDEIFQTGVSSREDLRLSLYIGVPPHKRGLVWSFLLGNFLAQKGREEQDAEAGGEEGSEPDYEECKEGSTEYHQTITLDLGRTFPTYPYFRDAQQKGQRELYSVLRAYSVADQEVGYCQGMSYIAGIFIIHSQDESQAFRLLYHYMYSYGFREHYKKNMFVLQVRMYQLSCQIHEYLPRLHAHLEEHSVSTYLIAAPWFLTMFSSQYPFAFVSRVMDLVLHEGMDAFFKVALALLTLHEDSLLQCGSMESISEFVKTTMPDKALEHLPYIMTYALRADAQFSLKLKGFETEYQVLHEMKQADLAQAQQERSTAEELEEVKKQNSYLVDQIAMCCGNIRKLETQVSLLHERDRERGVAMAKMEAQLSMLLKERGGT